MSIFGVILVRIFSAFSRIRIWNISSYSFRIRENQGKMRTRITPNTDNFYVVILGLLPSYFQKYLASQSNEKTYSARSSIQKKMKSFFARTRLFKTFFSCCAKEWSNLSKEIRYIDSISKLKSSVLTFIRAREKLIFAIHNINGNV